MYAGEQLHKRGREGAEMARVWLNRTARAKIEFDAANWPAQVTLQPLAGEPKSFDLMGYLLDEDGTTGPPLYVEVKRVTGPRDQMAQYLAYLATCYSVTARALDAGIDQSAEFMWLTWHPFYVTSWSQLCSEGMIKRALTKHPEVLGDHEEDDEVVALVRSRLWMIVMSERHPELSMPKWVMAEVEKILSLEDDLR